MAGEAKALVKPFQEAVDFFRQKTNMPSSHWTAVMDEAHARSFAVAGATDKALIQDFRDAIDKGLSEGKGFREFRGTFDDLVKKYGWKHTGDPGWRARIIYETNMSTAYAAGRYAQMTQPAVLAAFPYWQYHHVNCPHPRLQHLAWDGMVLRADDPFWATCYPPNGWGCHCIVTATNDRGLVRMGKDGLDDSPKLQWREYINRTTGIITKYPVGVDPGFVGNPGKAWLEKKPIPVTPDVKPVVAHKPIALPKTEKFATPDAANDALRVATAPWAETLTDGESQALEDYKGNFGRAINAAARGLPDADKAWTGQAKILEAALDRSKMPMTVQTWRAIGPAEAAIYAAKKIGDTVAMEGFLSTSVDEDVATRLSRKENRVVVKIIVPKGTRGAAYVHPFPKYQIRQYEVLLNIGVKLRIVRNDGTKLVMIAGDEDQ